VTDRTPPRRGAVVAAAGQAAGGAGRGSVCGLGRGGHGL